MAPMFLGHTVLRYWRLGGSGLESRMNAGRGTWRYYQYHVNVDLRYMILGLLDKGSEPQKAGTCYIIRTDTNQFGQHCHQDSVFMGSPKQAQ